MIQTKFLEYVVTENLEMVKKGLKLKSIDVNKKNRQGYRALDVIINKPGFQSTFSIIDLEILAKSLLLYL